MFVVNCWHWPLWQRCTGATVKSRRCKQRRICWGFFLRYGGWTLKWWVFPNKPMGFSLRKNDQHLGCEMGGYHHFKGNTHYECLGFIFVWWFFIDSTMVNHHQTTIWENMFCFFLSSILSKSKLYACFGMIFWNVSTIIHWKKITFKGWLGFWCVLR